MLFDLMARALWHVVNALGAAVSYFILAALPVLITLFICYAGDRNE